MTNKIINSIVLLIYFILSSSSLFSQGIEFREMSYEKAKEVAKKDNKLIFIDCFTEWCGPCKQLATTTFMDEKVGKIFNERYINLKIDMEKGEGIDLVKQFAVRVYPTLLLVDSENKIIFRTEGAPNDVDKFLELFEKGCQINMNLEEMEREYNSGEMSKQRMLDYIFLLSNIREIDKIKQLHSELLGRLTDEEKFSNDYLEIVLSPFGNMDHPENFLFILNNFDYLKNQHSEDKVNNIISRVAWLLVRSISLLQMDKMALHEKYVDSYVENLEKIDFPDKMNTISCFKMTQTLYSNQHSEALNHLLEINFDKISAFDAKSIIELLKEINKTEPVLVKQFVERKHESVKTIEDFAGKALISGYFNQF